jgi:hypothetical protein
MVKIWDLIKGGGRGEVNIQGFKPLLSLHEYALTHGVKRNLEMVPRFASPKLTLRFSGVVKRRTRLIPIVILLPIKFS